MAHPPLTTGAVSNLQVAAIGTVITSKPTVKVVELEELNSRQKVGNLMAKHKGIVEDADGERIDIYLAEDAVVKAHQCAIDQHQVLTAGSVVNLYNISCEMFEGRRYMRSVLAHFLFYTDWALVLSGSSLSLLWRCLAGSAHGVSTMRSSAVCWQRCSDADPFNQL